MIGEAGKAHRSRAPGVKGHKEKRKIQPCVQGSEAASKVRGRPVVGGGHPEQGSWCDQRLLWTWPRRSRSASLYPLVLAAVLCWTPPDPAGPPCPHRRAGPDPALLYRLTSPRLPQRPHLSDSRPGWSLRKPWVPLPRAMRAVVYHSTGVLDATAHCCGAPGGAVLCTVGMPGLLLGSWAGCFLHL